MTKGAAFFAYLLYMTVLLQASCVDDVGHTCNKSRSLERAGIVDVVRPYEENLGLDGVEIIKAHQDFMKTLPARAVFFALYQGCDQFIIQPLVLRALNNCPSYDLFAGAINQAIWNDSPGVKALRVKINDGSYSGTQRADFKKQLAAIQATDFAQKLWRNHT